jgi:hypothetical protein
MPNIKRFNIWLVGDTPLICHAWSEKARRDMLDKQVKQIKAEGREQRSPEDDFLNSLYDMGNETYGFPITAIKKAMRESAHFNRGIAKVDVFPSIWLDHDIVRVRPALADAICDMPLIRIVAERPEMREDMGRIGSGLAKKANLIYRGQFFPWALNITGRVNISRVPEEAMVNLLSWSGMEIGIGEWRTEKSGVMGAFHPASEEEAQSWARFRSGNGPIPQVRTLYQEAAD